MSFDVIGRSLQSASVLAHINVTAYGLNAYSKELDPCLPEYNITQLCPVQAGPFAATGQIALPESILSGIPSIAFQIPDLEGTVTMNLISRAGENLICLEAPVGNGRTLASTSLQVATGVFALSTILVGGATSMAASFSSTLGSGVLSATAPGVASSPGAGDVFLWFQALGTNGMLSVAQPSILRSFYTNFAWASGLVPWMTLQENIDAFRNKTGGNLTASSLTTLDNTTLTFSASSGRLQNNVNRRTSKTLSERGLATDSIAQSQPGSSSLGPMMRKTVIGIQAFVERLGIPSRNLFTTVLIVFSSVVGAILAFGTLTKIVLTSWMRVFRLPKTLRELCHNAWKVTASLLMRLILIVYGLWCIICVYQFQAGDSWAATILAALTLFIFSGIIGFFSFKIINLAMNKGDSIENGVHLLYKRKEYLQKYGLFYDQFRPKFWWFFIPCNGYSVLKALCIAFGNGHGLVQIIGCLVIELSFLLCLLLTQAYIGRQANAVNISISVVRILSLGVTLLFVDLIGLKETTKTALGIAVIIVQAMLTVVLAGLIALNGILPLIRKSRKDGRESSKNAEEAAPLHPDTSSREKCSLEHTRTFSSKLSTKPYIGTVLKMV